LLRVLVKKDLRGWNLLLSHAELAYNCAPSRTTNESPFMVVYGQNPLSPLDHIPIHQGEKINTEAHKRVKERVEVQTKKTNEHYQD